MDPLNYGYLSYMSSFLPKISDLQAVPDINFLYAKNVLSLVINKILEFDEVNIGIDNDEQGRIGSMIAFAADDIDRVIVRLEYFPSDYLLILEDNSENMDTSVFTYRISDQDELIESIPNGLRELMEEVSFEGEPRVIIPKTLTS